ncbi:VOC family protein [Embleya sp. AB8]|uniref:VOC family protein n=1 Tax=Embleya sp. AB8 TaxID=3156304 RepID=UPI003C71CF94
MMTIRRINHIVLSVRDLDVSTRFYRDVLGLRVVARLAGTAHWPAMAFLRSTPDSTNHHDLGLIANADAAADGLRRPGLFHAAFEVGTIDELQDLRHRLAAAGALGSDLDQGMHLSVYGHDPDGIAVEIIWRVPAEDWSYADELRRAPLDFDRARQRWGGRLATGSAAGAPS